MIDDAADPVLSTIRFHVSAADYAAAQRNGMRWFVRRGRTWALLGAFMLLCAALNAPTPGGLTPMGIASGAGGALAFLLVWYLVAYAIMPLLGRRAIKMQPNLRHEWRVDVSERGLRAVTPNQDNFVAWADYVGWSEDARVILFYQGERMFQFIPKRGLPPGFLDIVRRLAAHIPKR